MRSLTTEEIATCIAASGGGHRLKAKLRPALVSKAMELNDWSNFEFIAIPTRDRRSGVLIIASGASFYSIAYELTLGLKNSKDGRPLPIICDFCKTWQTGGRAGSITFRTGHRSLNSVGYLCCADLQCSLHIRDKTSVAKTSRSQLRENITPERRIERLESKLQDVIKRLGLNEINSLA